jgi:Insecticide toxin TcdB middle/N-terminal region/Salmonella virulence plasmid 65kDa B protein
MKKIILSLLLFLLSSFNAYAWVVSNGTTSTTLPDFSVNKKTVAGFKKVQVNDLFSWAGAFSIDFDLPQGVAGMTTDFSLSYNSYSSESFSPYGYGWSLSIQPLTRNSRKGTDKLYTSNEFFADGSEVVLTNTGTSLYESKDASNLKKYYFENGTWRVVDEKGSTFWYGLTAISQLVHPTDSTKVYAWYLEKQSDVYGNEIKYRYFKDQNQVYLQDIQYAFNGITPAYKVQFSYVDKTKTSTSYRTQFEVKTSKILDSIALLVEGVEKKRYTFSYDSLSAPFSHLIEVKEHNGTQVKTKQNFVYGTGKDTHLLKTITNNSGLKVDFEYQSSTAYKENGQSTNKKLPFNLRTLSKIIYTDLLSGKTLTEDYSYAGGYYYWTPADVFGREYAGFHKVTKSDSSGRKEIDYFHQWAGSEDGSSKWEYQDHISKKGRMYRQEIYDGTTLLKKSLIKWVHVDKGNTRMLVLKDTEVDILKNATAKATQYLYATNYGLLTEKRDFW